MGRVPTCHAIVLCMLLVLYLHAIAMLSRLVGDNSCPDAMNLRLQTNHPKSQSEPYTITVEEHQAGSADATAGPTINLFANPSNIYRAGNWDGAPIVVEEYKLIFFTQAKVASTVFKQLLRRMMHVEDWMMHKEPHIPHNPAKNGLTYLYQLPPDKALHVMTAPDWTRAIFVRDPKERALSAYLDKAARKNGSYVHRHCCYSDKNQTCAKKASRSFKDFIEVVSTSCCCDPHWKSQSKRIDAPFWKYINFVGRFESLGEDTKLFLEHLDASELGVSGWGTHGNESIFAEGTGTRHQTSARAKLRRYYEESNIAAMVEDFYASDYAHSLLNFSRNTIF
jgi:hypothetical protein